MKRYAFIGGGRIATALIMAMLSGGVSPENIFVSDIDEKILSYHRKNGLVTANDNAAAAAGADVIIIAVKPQHFDGCVPGFSNEAAGKIVVSVAAGISIGHIRRALPGVAAVVRVMPNTPMLLGSGTSALAFDGASEEDKAEIIDIFARCGKVFEVPESMMDIVTAISGSGPAYFYRVAAAMADEACALGMGKELAVSLAASTMTGAARMLLETGKTPQELIRDVASPGGTTMAALSAFDDAGLDGAVRAGVFAAHKRSEELGGKK